MRQKKILKAENGDLDAMEHLSHWYQDGITPYAWCGIEKDSDKAEYWSKKVAEIRRKNAESLPTAPWMNSTTTSDADSKVSEPPTAPWTKSTANSDVNSAFGVTSTSENEIQPPVGQSIQETFERARLSANSKANESKPPVRQNLPDSDNRLSRNKKVFIVSFILIAVAGLMMMLVSYGGSTPDTVDQFVKRYNTEIKRTAGAIVKNKYNGMSYLVENCTLGNLYYTDGGKGQDLFSRSVFFSGFDKSLSRLYPNIYSANQAIPLSVRFNFNSDAPADAVFAIIEASIAAAGDDEEKVMTFPRYTPHRNRRTNRPQLV